MTTRDEWLTSEDPQRMLMWLKPPDVHVSGTSGASPYAFLVTDRKLRLFACAMWGGHPEIVASHAAPGLIELSELSERIADVLASEMEIAASRLAQGLNLDGGALPYWQYVLRAARRLRIMLPHRLRPDECRRQASVLRDLIDPYAPPSQAWTTCADCDGVGSRGAWRCPTCRGDGAWPAAWIDDQAMTLALEAYHERPAGAGGQLDPLVLSVLADRLEELGCDERYLLDHLHSPAPHWRGCWALDAILGRD